MSQYENFYKALLGIPSGYYVRKTISLQFKQLTRILRDTKENKPQGKRQTR